MAFPHMPGYRKTCADLIVRYREAEKPPFPGWRIALVCSLKPDAVADLDPVEAIARESLDRNPQDPRAHHALETVLFRAGRFVEAAAVFDQAAKVRRRTVLDDWVWQAMSEFKTGRPDKAFVWLERADSWMKRRKRIRSGWEGIQNTTLLTEAHELLGLPAPDFEKKPENRNNNQPENAARDP